MAMTPFWEGLASLDVSTEAEERLTKDLQTLSFVKPLIRIKDWES
jgi:hypothetical protein